MNVKRQERNGSKFSAMHLDVHRRNLMQVCRLSVKSLIDKSCFERIDGECAEFQNFAAIFEQILNHRLKTHMTWYGVGETRSFWEFIKQSCRALPNSCISNVDGMENIRTSWAKGRAWLRLTLMEKRLSEYMVAAINQDKTIRSMYEPGAFLLCSEAAVLTEVLRSLDSIDFSFCLKGESLECGQYAVIDYTPYLKFQQSPESVESDEQEFEMLSKSVMESETLPNTDGAENEQEEVPDVVWQVKYQKLDSMYRNTCAQKSYVEELLKRREVQLAESESERHKLIAAMEQQEKSHKKEKEELEGIVIELQGQLASQWARNRSSSTEGTEMFPLVDVLASRSSSEHQVMTWYQSPAAVVTASSDVTSLRSVTSIGSATTVGRVGASEDSQSMVGLAGSLVSQSSMLQAGPATTPTATSKSESVLTASVTSTSVLDEVSPLRPASMSIDEEIRQAEDGEEKSRTAELGSPVVSSPTPDPNTTYNGINIEFTSSFSHQEVEDEISEAFNENGKT